METAKKLNIKDWSEESRPREKLQSFGRKSLSNAEYLAILLGSGSADETAIDLAQRILASVQGDLSRLARCSVEELCVFKGVGPAKAINIIAAMELGNRKQAHEADQKKTVIFNNPQVIYDHFRPVFSGLEVEEMWALFLNRGNRILGKKKIGIGGRSGVMCDNKVLLTEALLHKCSVLVLLHNHPSGNLTPSSADIKLTKKVFEACKLIDIQFLDHLIVSDAGYLSFKNQEIFPT